MIPAGVEVWNTPLWEAQTTITRMTRAPHVMHVFTRIKGAQSVKVSPDYSGPSNDTTYQYTYDLYGIPQADGGALSSNMANGPAIPSWIIRTTC